MITLQKLIKTSIAIQRGAYNRGHENQGASIDVLSEVLRVVTAKNMQKNKKAVALRDEIMHYNDMNSEALKYAKNLSYAARETIRKTVTALVA